MADNNGFNTSISVNTTDAHDKIKNLKSTVDGLTTSFRDLDGAIKAGDGSLKSAVSGVTQLLQAARQAAAAEKQLAQSKILTTKAEADAAKQANATAESRAKQEALAARARASDAQAARTTNAQANDNIRTSAAAANADASREASLGRLTIAQDRHRQSMSRAAAAQMELTDNLSNTRYLLYDVGATYRTMALMLEAIPVATAAVAISYQKDFAQVERVTTGTQVNTGKLREEIKGLATDIPTSFSELSKISTIGAQIGIEDTAGLENLTETVAKFTASVDGVDVETATLSLGRMKSAFKEIDNTDAPGYFNSLGSAMAKVGATTAATDAEIVSMLNQIGPLGAEVRMSSAEVVGLAGALASVRVQPELARGTLTRVFAGINRAADEGAAGMEKYAKQMDISSQAALDMWKKDPSKFFQSLIGSMNAAYKSGQPLTGIMDDLGIKATRDVSALTKLAVGYDILADSNKTANEAFQEGTTLNDMSAKVFETVAAKLQMLGNAIQNIMDSLGKGGMAPLAGLLQSALDLARGFDGLIKDVPAIGLLVNALLGLAAVTGVFLGLKAANAFLLAGLVSFRQVLGSSVGSAMGLSGTLKELAVIMLMGKGASEAHARALIAQASGFRAVTAAATLSRDRIAATATVSSVAGNSMATAARGATTFMGSLKGVGSAALGLVGGLPGLIALLGVGLVGSLLASKSAADQAAQALGESMSKGADEALKGAFEQIKNFKMKNGATPDYFFDDSTTLAQVATRAQIPLDKMAQALANGRKGAREFRDEIERLAKARGEDLNGIALPGTWLRDAKAAADTVDRLAAQGEDASTAAGKVGDAMQKAGVQTADAAGNFTDGGDAIDDLDKKLKALNDTIFGTVNNEAALGDALAKLGESVYKSKSFGNDPGGRENIQNFEDAAAKAQKYYADLIKEGYSAQESALGYAQFIQDLIDQVKAAGGDMGPIEDLALQTVDAFKTTIGANATGANAPTVQVNADTTPAQTAADEVRSWINGLQGAVAVGADTSDGNAKLEDLARNLSIITGEPYQAVLDALTDPANEKAGKMQEYINQIVSGTYQAAVNADTSAAIANVRNFADYAHAELNSVQEQLFKLAASDNNFIKGAANSALGKGWYGDRTLPSERPSAPAPVAAAPAPRAAPGPNIGGQMSDGLNKAAAAADKAGKAGKKAGEDTADGWKDAYNAIDQATAAADDYANRLKQGLDRAFEKQYGMAAATDNYYKALNAITKKREEELKQLDDLRDKLKGLNNERDKDLIDARKARTEASISQKYGETDRMVDYQNQAKTAEDNAAAKAKDIAATQKQIDTLKSGIGQFNGYTDAAIANREALRDLESKMTDMIVAYAKTGASTDQVREYARKLGAQFTQQAGEATGNRAAVNNLSGDLGRYIGVVNKVPYWKPTKVTADTAGAVNGINGVQRALNGLQPWKQVVVDWKMTHSVREMPGYKYQGQQVWQVLDGNGNGTGSKFFNKGGQVQGFAGGGMIPGQSPSDPSVDNLMASVDGKGLVKVRSGEFIMQQPAVDFWGSDFMNAVNAMRMPTFHRSAPSAASAGGGGGMQVVALDAASLGALAAISDRPLYLFTNDEVIAQSAARGGTVLASKGVSL